MLGVSHDTIARLCKSGEIKDAWKTSGVLRMTRSAVENYRKSRKVVKR